MINELFSRSAYAEVITRRFFSKYPGLKNKIKAKRKKAGIKEKLPLNATKWAEYKKLVNDSVEDNSIVLIHASMDGLHRIGVDENLVMDLLGSLIDRGITVVTTAYPITNLKIKDKKMKPYNPEKTPCWSGMLANKFVASPLSIRSAVPYNSLAAMGPHAEEMMIDNMFADYVYGDHTPWKYCVEHHARILFIGTTCLDSNTIQTHMMADYMGDRWPIDNWYEVYDAPLKIKGEIVNKKINIQSNFWTKFVADYSTTRKLKEKGFLKEYMLDSCSFEYITDAYDMVKYLESECNQGRLMYIIPKNYWKKGWKKQ